MPWEQEAATGQWAQPHGTGLWLWLNPPPLADSGQAPDGQISVAGAGITETREKGRFMFAGLID